MPIYEPRRNWYRSNNLPLPGRPRKDPTRASGTTRVYATPEALAWWAELTSDDRGRLIERLHQVRL